MLTLLVTSFILYHFVKFEGNYNGNFFWSVLVIFSISTGQYGHYWPVKSGIKFFLAGMFFFGLHINTAYNSYLVYNQHNIAILTYLHKTFIGIPQINVLTNPRYDEQIDSVQKAIDAGMVFEVGENTVEFFEEKNDTVRRHIFMFWMPEVYH